jgi:hypothetical protein
VRYATSPKNITGCVLAISGPVLVAAGVLVPLAGLALMPVLYAAGALAAPARRRVPRVAGVDLREVERCLRDVQRRALPPVPREIRFKIKNITATIAAVLPRAGDLRSGSFDQYVLVRCATDYLPTAFQAYLALPRDYAEHRIVTDGKTPLALLLEQLDVLAFQVEAIAERVNRMHSDQLIAHGRFLEEKFGPGPLDLEAR